MERVHASSDEATGSELAPSVPHPSAPIGDAPHAAPTPAASVRSPSALHPRAAPGSGRLRRGGRGLRQAAERLRRSEEHTSELQSQSNLVCRLLLEKKNNS